MVSELDDPTWSSIECLPKVVSDFDGEQSRVHIMPISAKWKHKSSIHIGFIVLNGGVTTFFAKSVHVFRRDQRHRATTMATTPGLMYVYRQFIDTKHWVIRLYHTGMEFMI